MTETSFDPKTSIYTPQQASKYGLQAVDQIRKQQFEGLSLNMGELIDSYFAPVMPGQICAIIGQTSHYKSGFLHFIEHMAARQLMEQSREDEILVHISVEECVEEQIFLQFARYSGEDSGALSRGVVQDWDKLAQAATYVGQIPIYRIGDSLARAEDIPNLYLSNMLRSVKYLSEEMFDHKVRIAGLYFDYLQAFPIDPEIRASGTKDQQRRLQVRQDVYRLRQAAAYFRCPVFVGVQAKQELQGAHAPIMIPGVYDGEESSSIAQRCDRIISLWMPKQTHRVGSTIEDGSFSFVVAENMLFLKVCKQRGGLPAGKIWELHIDFRTNLIKVAHP